jgi:hypothetical protein
MQNTLNGNAARIISYFNQPFFEFFPPHYGYFIHEFRPPIDWNGLGGAVPTQPSMRSRSFRAALRSW